MGSAGFCSNLDLNALIRDSFTSPPSGAGARSLGSVEIDNGRPERVLARLKPVELVSGSFSFAFREAREEKRKKRNKQKQRKMRRGANTSRGRKTNT